MQVFAKYVAWENYFSTAMTQAAIEEEIAEQERKSAEARYVAAAMSAGGRKVTEVRAEMGAQLDGEVARARQKHLDLYATRKRLSAAADNVGRAAALISRELTRRGIRSNVDLRSQQRGA